MKRKVIKTGNSLAVTLPSEFIKEVGIKVGDEAEIESWGEKSKIVVRFVKKPRQIPLFSMK